jgi:hypothetical protein
MEVFNSVTELPVALSQTLIERDSLIKSKAEMV